MFAKLAVERAVRAFIAGAAGFLAVSAQTITLDSRSLKALVAGAVAAGVSGVFSIVSSFFGDPNSTSFTGATVSVPDAKN